MARIFESIRTQIEDLLFQWGQKENEYISTIQCLTEEKERLTIHNNELKQEVEFFKKQLEETRQRLRHLEQEQQAMLSKHKNNKWRLFL